MSAKATTLLLLLCACASAEQGTPDTGAAPIDAGRPAPDAGQPADDAGVEPDAGAEPDAGVEPDAGLAPDLSPGEHELTLVTPDGRTRRYLVHVPAQRLDPPPVVMNLHGGGGSAENTRDGTLMVPLAEQEGFLLVFPEGVPSSEGGGGPLGVTATWNAGVCCDPALEQDIDDVAYFDALLDDLATRIDYDPRRVYATGLSNGAMMSFRLACQLSERITAVAPVAGQGEAFECQPTRPVPIMYTHGTEDMCARYDGGAMCGGCFQRFLNAWLGTNIPVPSWPCTGAVAYMEQWRTRYGCAAPSTITYQNGNATCETWMCDDAVELTFCPVEGMGHSWPGGAPPPFCDRPGSAQCVAWLNEVGASSDDIGNAQIWAFFQRHALP